MTEIDSGQKSMDQLIDDFYDKYDVAKAIAVMAGLEKPGSTISLKEATAAEAARRAPKIVTNEK
ncbi:hypothetical protein [Schleiferilactobacillus shenzhenensis]|uniref:hypothetical protein n=1 Tax=Schleiferilactobacillus shenzhenensis TaxID=1231337 RepID=UPI0004011C5C|nr:hypothetical protein [Schleiferilactobacillus shenzhenensis]